MPENTRNALARVASKNRRDKEGTEIQQLTELLPFSREEQKSLEKEAVVRLVIAYIRLRQLMLEERGQAVARVTEGEQTTTATRSLPPPAGHLPLPSSQQVIGGQFPAPPPTVPEVTSSASGASACDGAGHGASQTHPPWGWYAETLGNRQGAPVAATSAFASASGINEGELLLEVLQGFLILINKKGRVLYVSSNVEEYLGVSQAWLLGRSVLECIHHDDVKELARQLELPAHKPAVFPQPLERVSAYTSGYSYNTAREFYLRMRQYPNGAGSRKKPGNFVLVHWTGQVRARQSSHVRSGRPRTSGLVCVCRPVQSNSVLHMRLGGNMFISRHDMCLTYTYCDPRVLFLIGYDPASLLGRNAYQFHNPADAHKCSDCHSTLIKTGTGVSKYYRFLGRTGVWVWMQTRATIISDTRGKPQYIVCNNYIISQKEGDQCHMMEQQRQQPQQHQALPMTDLTAKGAIDLVTLPPVTSPTSISSVDDDHDDASYNHDDTGYNTAVSSISSDSTSPSPMGGTGGMAGDLDHVLSPPDFRFTSDLHADSSGVGLYGVVTSVVAEPEFSVPEIPASISSSAASFQSGRMVSEGCGPDLTTSLSSKQSDPFLYSARNAGGCGEGAANVMEDMELLEDLLERIADCDKTETSHSVETELSHNDGEDDTLFGSSLTMSPQIGVKGQGDEDSVSEQDKLGNRSVNSSQKPASLLRTLLDKEGEALSERPLPAPKPATRSCSTGAPLAEKQNTACSERTFGPHNRDRRQKSVDQARARHGKQLVSDTVDLTQENESEGESEVLPADLPDDLLDFAMQYCDSLANIDPTTNLEAEMWNSTMDDLMASDSQNPDAPMSGRIVSGVSGKAVDDQSCQKTVAGKHRQTASSVSVNRSSQLAPLSSPSSSLSTAVLHSSAVNSSGGGKRTPDRTLTVHPVAKHNGMAAMLKSPSPQTQVPSPASCRVVSPALSDHRYSSARTLSPHSKSESSAGKRLCVEVDRHRLGRGKGSSAQVLRVHTPYKTALSNHSHVTYIRTQKPGSSLPGKIIIASPKGVSSTQNKTTLVVGPKLASPPPPTSPAPVPVPANGGGKPLTAMSELEKHLRGLAAPMERRSESDDTLTPVGECGDEASSRPFLERLLTGEISHERYRQIDYHLLYQERERRLSETCSGQLS